MSGNCGCPARRCAPRGHPGPGHRLDFEDAAEVRARLPRAGFDLVAMRLVIAFMAERAVGERGREVPAPGEARCFLLRA
ncbi:hypothetical protein EJ357_36890 [Streptomyces cyaneochromogenes]|uniref:Uncharacterized protein n=1 Tax=Streptomyces cyaneochromogenes TaxID=2496836 RepID=A0A3Q9EXA8_9ACTN|nr:hypothetical protein [Streptomyces cyaneochromogenes]AZQ38346.1 hypothetical protein EJ357_36890 [Streptomyces cyaneochromogenes]